MQGLADVPQVGQVSFAADPGQDPGRKAVGRRRLEHRRDPAQGEHLRPATQPVRDRVGDSVSSFVELAGSEAEEGRQRGGADAGAAVWLLEGLEKYEPFDSGRSREDAAAAGDHGRDADAAQRLAGGGQVGVPVADHRNVSGLDPASFELRARGQQRPDVQGQVARDLGAYLADDQGIDAALAELFAAYDAQPERRRVRGTGQPVGLVVRGYVVHHDPVVAECGTLENGLEGGEQRGVATPVDAQSLAPRGGVGGLKIGEDVPTAERVDRLLRVADQHHGGEAGEGPVEHSPLNGVGVLELVDEHDLPALAHPGAGWGVVRLQCVGELAEQVVVGQDSQPPLALLHLGADGPSEGDSTPGRCRRVLGRRLQSRLRVADGLAGDGHRLTAREDRVVVGPRERPQVEVVDDFGEQVVEVLDQSRPGVRVSGDSQRPENHAAELVGGGDRGRVEPGQCLADPAVAPGPLIAVAVKEQVQQVRVGVWRPVARERMLGLDKLCPDPFTQLLAGGATERDDQHLLQQCHALGDVASDERPDRPGLAGAGARLEQGGPGRQRIADVEDVAAHAVVLSLNCSLIVAPAARPRPTAAPRSARRTSRARHRAVPRAVRRRRTPARGQRRHPRR